MAHSDYDQENIQPLKRRIAALWPRTWQGAAFLFGTFALAGISSAAILGASAVPNYQASPASSRTSSAFGEISPEEQPDAQPQTPKATSSGQTTVSVNGQEVTVPANGTYHQDLSSGSTRGSLTVSSQHQASGSSNSSRTSINYTSDSSVETNP